MNTFEMALNGMFDGMIKVDHVRLLADRMAEKEGWFLVTPGEEPPTAPVSGAEARSCLLRLMDEILAEERGVWTTMVYAQSADDPTVVKVFHPRRAGCGCGPSSGVLPWRVLSRLPPTQVAAWNGPACHPLPAKPVWKRFFS